MNKVLYRAVKANDSNDVIAIGCDENQGEKNYNNIGVWCNFTFTEIPTPSKEILEYVKKHEIYNISKVENDTIVIKSLEELKAL